MSRETEKILKEIHKAIEADPSVTDNKEQFDELLTTFTKRAMQKNDEQDAAYYLEMAEDASSKKKALEYIKKALELEPGNIDALVMQVKISAASPEAMEKEYLAILKKAEKQLAAEGYFDKENIGDFWLIFETRPYMRLLDDIASLYKECGKMRKAADTCEKMLELCTGDNLGMRYILMHIYAFLEDEAAATALYKKYPDEGTQFLLPMSMLYYKLENDKKAEKYFSELCAVNKDVYKFFRAAVKGVEPEGLSEMGFGYRPGTIEELVIEMQMNMFLFISTPGFYTWAAERSKPIRKSKNAKDASDNAAPKKRGRPKKTPQTEE